MLLVLILWQRELISYGLMQGRGQLEVLWNARPLEEVLQDPAVPDSLKQRLLLIGDIREWGVARLGLKETNNYTTLYDQKGQEILWVITACHPYKLENREWRFPVVGTVSYKGFFDHERALAEKAELDAAGWDTHIRPVSAWSTLGWFRDPILSNMLFRPEGDVANTVLHELTHATIFVKDSLMFNENLASFIGHQGALLFLKDRFGPQGEPLQRYQERYQDRHLFSQHVLRGLSRLDSLYSSFPESLPEPQKQAQKQALIQQIIDETAALPLHRAEDWRRFFAEQQPNNAYFMSYERYSGGLEELETAFEEEFGGDLTQFLTYYKKRYGR
ncbi:aminopeptidase [Cesiribacter andamanensis]|uniref:aminopeptidase n=1 Tax=Cesiribacter andamanensis TaxID=649507 RepID=UPI001F4494D3|nr:aminopeptidase [Cesiribacter andamanensis]